MVAQKPAPTMISAGGQKKVVTPTKKPQKKLFVVKLQRIPFGFFERELLGYFRQFGTVLRIRVARSRKTGNHKGWAYVGFDNKAVAEIAAETMNGYLMFEHRLGCKVMKPSLIPKSMLKGPLLTSRPPMRGTAKKDAIARNNTTGKKDLINSAKRSKHLEKVLQGLKNMGVDYDFPVSGVVRTPVKKVVDNDVQVIATPKAAAKAAQKVVTPKAATPKPATPKAVTPKAVTPKVATPVPATPKVAITATPKTTKKVVITEPIKTPQTEKLKKVENTPKFSPKTRAAKAAAAGTPLVKSTLSKTILKSVAASARPAALEKKPLAGNKRGKKKSL